MVYQLLTLIIPPLVGLVSFSAISVGSFVLLLASSSERVAVGASRERTQPQGRRSEVRYF
jgi:hypothetical protein